MEEEIVVGSGGKVSYFEVGIVDEVGRIIFLLGVGFFLRTGVLLMFNIGMFDLFFVYCTGISTKVLCVIDL